MFVSLSLSAAQYFIYMYLTWGEWADSGWPSSKIRELWQGNGKEQPRIDYMCV